MYRSHQKFLAEKYPDNFSSFWSGEVGIAISSSYLTLTLRHCSTSGDKVNYLESLAGSIHDPLEREGKRAETIPKL